ncbi:MAG: type II toxin-antitoxin system HicA family toxin [Chloroflexi bacterium]|nr:type II toxin-antitoxin system HicA family toxin [Chloroflexota bacterium]
MATYTYNDFRKVLERLGFELVRQRDHETWRKIEGRLIWRVTLSHQHRRDIPRPLFRKMLKQANLADEETFARSLHGK